MPGSTGITNEFECIICTDEYAQTRRPLIFECGHSFCERCILGEQENQVMDCPTCREEIDVIIVNYGLLAAHEAYKKLRREQRKSTKEIRRLKREVEYLKLQNGDDSDGVLQRLASLDVESSSSESEEEAPIPENHTPLRLPARIGHRRYRLDPEDLLHIGEAFDSWELDELNGYDGLEPNFDDMDLSRADIMSDDELEEQMHRPPHPGWERTDKLFLRGLPGYVTEEEVKAVIFGHQPTIGQPSFRVVRGGMSKNCIAEFEGGQAVIEQIIRDWHFMHYPGDDEHRLEASFWWINPNSHQRRGAAVHRGRGYGRRPNNRPRPQPQNNGDNLVFRTYNYTPPDGFYHHEEDW